MQPLHQVWYWSSEGVKRYWADNTVGWKEWFDLDLWTFDLKIDRDHLLIEGNPCTKFGIDQLKGSKDDESTTEWAEKSGLTINKPGNFQTKVHTHVIAVYVALDIHTFTVEFSRFKKYWKWSGPKRTDFLNIETHLVHTKKGVIIIFTLTKCSMKNLWTMPAIRISVNIPCAFSEHSGIFQLTFRNVSVDWILFWLLVLIYRFILWISIRPDDM